MHTTRRALDFGVALQGLGMGDTPVLGGSPLIPAGILCSIHLFREDVPISLERLRSQWADRMGGYGEVLGGKELNIA